MTEGPRVVAIGGGHGLAVTLRAARHYAGAITAIVTVADDGGSSGRLREAADIPAPGDVRRCLVALSDTEPAFARAFEYRFEHGDVAGHALGNLVIAALAHESGGFVEGIAAAGRLLGVVGNVLPATVAPVQIEALVNGKVVRGQVAVQHAGAIERVMLHPADPPAPPMATKAIETADQIVLGPGSLYTSVLSAAVVPAIASALRAATAPRIYVCNLRPEGSETADYDVAAHVRALEVHGIPVDVVVRDPAALPLGDVKVRVVDAPLARPSGRAHDDLLLAGVLRTLL